MCVLNFDFAFILAGLNRCPSDLAFSLIPIAEIKFQKELKQPCFTPFLIVNESEILPCIIDKHNFILFANKTFR